MISRCLLSNANVGCWTRTASQVSVHAPPSRASSAIRRRVSSRLTGAQKNSLWRVRQGTFGLVRPATTARARSVVRRHPRLSRHRGAARRLPSLRQGETGAARLPGRQSALHQTLRLLRGSALPQCQYQGRGPGTEARLAHGQGVGETVHDGAVGPRGETRTQGHRHRRDLDQEGPYLPYRRKRSHPGSSRLVRW